MEHTESEWRPIRVRQSYMDSMDKKMWMQYASLLECLPRIIRTLDESVSQRRPYFGMPIKGDIRPYGSHNDMPEWKADQNGRSHNSVH